jgi:hypothetical protein
VSFDVFWLPPPSHALWPPESLSLHGEHAWIIIRDAQNVLVLSFDFLFSLVWSIFDVNFRIKTEKFFLVGQKISNFFQAGRGIYSPSHGIGPFQYNLCY